MPGGDENPRVSTERPKERRWGAAPRRSGGLWAFQPKPNPPLGTILRRNGVQAKDALHSSKSDGRAAHITEGYGWHGQFREALAEDEVCDACQSIADGTAKSVGQRYFLLASHLYCLIFSFIS